MAGRLAIDFGTSNTRAAIWDEVEHQAKPLLIPEVSVMAPQMAVGDKEVAVSYIPSLIHYDGQKVWIGRQVREQGKLQAPATFRWMKRYISSKLELPRNVNGRRITFSEAGADFLSLVTNFATSLINFDDEEVAFTAPVEAFEHYQDWLTTVCDKAGIRSYRLLDEASAAALGYGVHIQTNDVYMVFDFGGGTLDTSIVRIEESAIGGKKCHVLGKGGCEIGGTLIDQWLYEDVLQRNKKTPEDVLPLSALLLMEAERTKEELSAQERAQVSVTDPTTGAVLYAEYTRGQFEDLLEKKGLFSHIQGALDCALGRAKEHGYEREHIKAVLLVGGSSLMPCVRRAVRQLFGERVQYHRPLDAVVLGGAAFVGGVDFYDHIQHDYGLRFFDRSKADYDFKIIVPAGTPYPTPKDKPVCQITVKASHAAQEFLGLGIYEISRKHSIVSSQALDLVYDTSGCARLQAREDLEILCHRQIGKTEFIHAAPPAEKGEPRFPVRFSIDGNKRLCVTVHDNKIGKFILKDHPLVKLT